MASKQGELTAPNPGVAACDVQKPQNRRRDSFDARVVLTMMVVMMMMVMVGSDDDEIPHGLAFGPTFARNSGFRSWLVVSRSLAK